MTAVVAVKTGLTLEVLVGDDGSSDGTRDILSNLSLPGVTIIFMPDNVGRGGVIKHLWTLATGEVIVHQDADLEYDPQDYIPMLAPLLARVHGAPRPTRRPLRRGSGQFFRPHLRGRQEDSRVRRGARDARIDPLQGVG